MKQPQERQFKHIIVSIWYRGKYRWAMVAAKKEGDHYKISEDVFEKLISHVAPHTTYTVG